MVKFTYPKGKTSHFPICPIAPSFGTVQSRIQTYGGGGGASRPWDKGGAVLTKNIFGPSGLSLVQT